MMGLKIRSLSFLAILAQIGDMIMWRGHGGGEDGGRLCAGPVRCLPNSPQSPRARCSLTGGYREGGPYGLMGPPRLLD